MARRKFTIAELRARSGMTQAEAAAKLGVNSAIYSAWENLTEERVADVAKIFGVSDGDILIPSDIKKI